MAPFVGHFHAHIPKRREKAMLGAGLQQIDRTPLERSRTHADRAVDQEQVMPAELAEEFVQLDQGFGHGIGFVVGIVMVVDIAHGASGTGDVGRVESLPEIGNDAEKYAESRRFLAAAVAELQPDLLIFLG